MKKLFYLTMLLSLSAFADPSGWLQNYDAALAKAAKTGKPVLMMYAAKD